MADVLTFRDDEEKADRRARAAARRRAEMDARCVASCIVLLNDVIAMKPDGSGDTPALDHARWITDAQAILREVKGQPAQVRTEAGVAALSVKLKGLVDEAELQGFIEVTASEPPALVMAREVNDDLRARMDARRAPVTIIESNPGGEGGWVRERFLRPASLTPDLVSDNLQLPGRTSSPAVKTADPVPSSSLAGSATFTGTDLLSGYLQSLFHGVKVRRLWRKVREKARGAFSLGNNRPHPDDLGGGAA